MSASEFGFLINLVGGNISKTDTAFRKAISVQASLALTLPFNKFSDTPLSPLHFTITKTLNKPHNTTDSHQSSRQSIRNETKGSRADGGDESRCPCSGRYRIIPLMRRPNTDSTPNKPVKSRDHKSVHTVTIQRYLTSVHPPSHSTAIMSNVTFLGGLDVQIYINWLVTATKSKRFIYLRSDILHSAIQLQFLSVLSNISDDLCA
jgi:hypothetical protein